MALSQSVKSGQELHPAFLLSVVGCILPIKLRQFYYYYPISRMRPTTEKQKGWMYPTDQIKPILLLFNHQDASDHWETERLDVSNQITAILLLSNQQDVSVRPLRNRKVGCILPIKSNEFYYYPISRMRPTTEKQKGWMYPTDQIKPILLLSNRVRPLRNRKVGCILPIKSSQIYYYPIVSNHWETERLDVSYRSNQTNFITIQSRPTTEKQKSWMYPTDQIKPILLLSNRVQALRNRKVGCILPI